MTTSGLPVLSSDRHMCVCPYISVPLLNKLIAIIIVVSNKEEFGVIG